MEESRVYAERRKKVHIDGVWLGRGDIGHRIKRIAKEEDEERKAKRGKRGPS